MMFYISMWKAMELDVTQAPQPYDSALKTLLEGQAMEVISSLISDVVVDEELNDEILKPPLRADRIYLGRWQGDICVVQVEMETGANSEMAYRLLEYYGILLKKYRGKPVISVVIYPFRTSLPESPLCVVIGDKEILTFHFIIIALWLLSAKDFLNKRAVSVYTLLPTMQDATYDVLAQALDKMKGWYNEDRRRLSEQILLFGTFLQRSDMVLPEDKRKIGEKLDMFDSLLEENRFVRKKAAEAKAEGQAEGTVTALQQAVIDVVEERFPSLVESARNTVVEVKEPLALRILLRKISTAPSEDIARWLLGISAV